MRVNFYQRVAKHLPKKLIYFATIQLGAYCTCGKYDNTVVPDLRLMDAVKRYGDDHKI